MERYGRLGYNSMWLGRNPEVSVQHISITFRVEEYAMQETSRKQGASKDVMILSRVGVAA
jgi:hypothetical protein